jgi:hypothetical protein
MPSKKNTDGKMPIYYILITISLVVIALYAGYKLSMIKPLGSNQDHAIFKDILQTTLAISALFVTLLGIIVYKIVQSNLEKSVESKTELEMKYMSAYIFTAMSYNLWLHYDIGGEQNKPYFLQAINTIEEAYNKYAQHLDRSLDRNLRLICDIANSWGYYLAQREQEADKLLALEWAKLLEDNITRFPDRNVEWQDTISFIRAKYPQAG